MKVILDNVNKLYINYINNIIASLQKYFWYENIFGQPGRERQIPHSSCSFSTLTLTEKDLFFYAVLLFFWEPSLLFWCRIHFMLSLPTGLKSLSLWWSFLFYYNEWNTARLKPHPYALLIAESKSPHAVVFSKTILRMRLLSRLLNECCTTIINNILIWA